MVRGARAAVAWIGGSWSSIGASLTLLESTAEMGDFLSRGEPIRMMCDTCSLADVVAGAQRRAAVLSAELKRLETLPAIRHVRSLIFAGA